MTRRPNYREPSHSTFDREALESFSEVLEILREWDQGERKKPGHGASNDPASACLAEGESVD
jgi:hypothetical protein